MMLPDVQNLIDLQLADREVLRLKEEIAALPKRVAAIERSWRAPKRFWKTPKSRLRPTKLTGENTKPLSRTSSRRSPNIATSRSK